MAEGRNQSGLDGAPSISALGLRWAALRGMLASPLIEAEEQRGLRDELLRELQSIEQDFASVPARTAIEISAKVDVARTALRDGVAESPHWLVALLESVQSDLRSLASAAPAVRSQANLTRTSHPRAEAAGTRNGGEPEPTEA